MSKSVERRVWYMRSCVMLIVLGGLPFGAGAETLDDLLKRFAGSETEISGHIGTGLNIMDDEALSFRDKTKVVYPVVFDAGRDARKALEGCKFAMFGGGSPCELTGKAEIEMDGSAIRLIIFEVTNIADPAPLN